MKSRDRGELDMMLDALNIQVDNPCAVLEQEISKTLLKDGEHALYGMFLRITELERIQEVISQ